MERLNRDEARQGRGRRNLYILVGALVLAAIAFIILAFYGWILPDSTLEETTPEAAVEEPATGGEVGTDDILVGPEESEEGAATPEPAE